MLLRLLHCSVVLADGDAPRHDDSDLRHLRWRLSLARTQPALRMVQSEVARLVRVDGSSVDPREGGKRVREEEAQEGSLTLSRLSCPMEATPAERPHATWPSLEFNSEVEICSR